jgi:hypothetical protein
MSPVRSSDVLTPSQLAVVAERLPEPHAPQEVNDRIQTCICSQASCGYCGPTAAGGASTGLSLRLG